MKKILCLLLALLLIVFSLSGCKKKKADTEGTETSGGGLTQALEETNAGPGYTIVEDETDIPDDFGESDTDAYPENEIIPEADLPTSYDDSSEQPPETDSVGVMPFATATAQPNAVVSQLAEVSGSGLGFKFSYPANWINIPGRNSICYVQPLEDGTIYPARVCVTMKRLYHPCTAETLKEELVSYLNYLKAHSDNPKTFQIRKKDLDEETRFMGGKTCYSIPYLAYDNGREIKGYVICTHFERYVYVFHFLCAYEDYESFYPSMCRMRDSVEVEEVKQ